MGLRLSEARRSRWATLAVGADWFISVAARARKIVSSHCRTSPVGHCALHGAIIAITPRRHWLFPNAVGSAERIRTATTHMDRGGTQAAMKAVVDESRA